MIPISIRNINESRFNHKKIKYIYNLIADALPDGLALSEDCEFKVCVDFLVGVFFVATVDFVIGDFLVADIVLVIGDFLAVLCVDVGSLFPERSAFSLMLAALRISVASTVSTALI